MSEREEENRRAELAGNLARLERRIAAACRSAGRDRSELTLVAVTKTFPVTDVGHLAALGVRDVGENRDRDASIKAEQCRRAGLTGLVWHFVGQVQTNKAASVSSYADVVHSVDRIRLVTALEKGAAAAGRRLTCLVQVNLTGPADSADNASDPAARGGTPPEQVEQVAAAIDGSPHLELGGVMAVAPLGADPQDAFARLDERARLLRASYPQATVVSAGMSADLEAAVRHGATHLRVGTALLGSRPALG